LPLFAQFCSYVSRWLNYQPWPNFSSLLEEDDDEAVRVLWIRGLHPRLADLLLHHLVKVFFGFF
jgi:hypothetical protein